MAGRGRPANINADLAAALNGLTEVLRAQAQFMQGAHAAPGGEHRGLDKFLKRDPPTFKGEYNPDGAYKWMTQVEKTLNSMNCTDNQKVNYASYLLEGEAETWWTQAKPRMIQANLMTWIEFKRVFMEKYFPEDVKARKEVEFLELKQGNMTIGQYAAKFEELAQFHPSYRDAANENSKCIKFENGLRPDIKAAIGYQQIRNFYTLVDKCCIFENDDKQRKEYLKTLGPQKNFRGGIDKKKPFQKAFRSQSSSSSEKNKILRCYNCGGNHYRYEFPHTQAICYRCKQLGHVSINCPNPKVESSNNERGGAGNRNNNNNNKGKKENNKAPARGRVFTLTGADLEPTEDQIQGTCFMNGIPLVVLYDSGATHSFIVVDLVKRLRLATQSLVRKLIVSTPTGDTVSTTFLCKDCPLVIKFVKVIGKDLEESMRDSGTSCLRKGMAFNDA
ncbi:uncharacterized protein LOC130713125 [Lotus japonicus]|uniref:uncharacterized protein LOC130713125 n=1 Tax=Lotus japonicus TaxID=34305 RepID=UPI0025856A9F|nr:uncharacterized protein LOC130713125 [Lotus japonicus]